MTARAGGDLVLPVVQLGDQDDAPVAGFDDELAEAVEPGVALVEVGIDLLHDLLEPVGTHYIAVAGHLATACAASSHGSRWVDGVSTSLVRPARSLYE